MVSCPACPLWYVILIRCFDHHRQLQRARRSRALPRVASRRRRRRFARDHRRRQRVDRRQRRRRAALAGRAGHRGRSATSASRRATTSASAPAAARNLLLLNSDTIVPPGAIDRLRGRAAARSPTSRSSARAWSTATAAPSCRSGAMIGPFNERRQKLLVRGHARRDCRLMSRHRGAMTRARAVAGLGQRRLPARPARGCRSGRPARRALLHVHRGRRLLRGHPRARPRRPVHAGGRGRPPARPVGGHGVSGDARGLPAQPPRVLREAPSGWRRFCARICGWVAAVARLELVSRDRRCHR